jgi:hypothetical protein
MRGLVLEIGLGEPLIGQALADAADVSIVNVERRTIVVAGKQISTANASCRKTDMCGGADLYGR